MNVNFPLIAQAGSILSLDDEAIFHRLLSRALHQWRIRCFTDISAFTSEMGEQVAMQELACKRLTQILADWRDEGASLRASVIDFWNDESLHGLASLVMVDFRMPHASGIEVLSTPTLQAWRGGKLLLTAHADDRVAVEAFNGSLIDQFVSKQVMADGPSIICTIVESVAEAGNDALQRVWASQVTHQQQQCLEVCRGPVIELMRRNHWVCHAVFGQPFGILGKTTSGLIQWLQLETDESFNALLELLDASGVNAQDRKRIEERVALPLLEMDIGNGSPDVQCAFELGVEGSPLLGALFDVAASQ